jgi:hypothetical protein
LHFSFYEKLKKKGKKRIKRGGSREGKGRMNEEERQNDKKREFFILHLTFQTQKNKIKIQAHVICKSSQTISN